MALPLYDCPWEPFTVMPNPPKPAIVVGAGPNGLVAAITLAKAGFAVTAYEANEKVGGGARSGELTLPGFVHDICSAVNPLGIGYIVLG